MVQNYFLRGYSLPYLIDVISKGMGEMMGGVAQNLFTRPLNRASYAYKKRMIALREKIEGKLEEIMGKNYQDKMLEARIPEPVKVKDEDGNMVDLTEPIMKDGKKVETPLILSQEQRAYLYNQFKDPGNHPRS